MGLVDKAAEIHCMVPPPPPQDTQLWGGGNDEAGSFQPRSKPRAICFTTVVLTLAVHWSHMNSFFLKMLFYLF